MSSLLVFWFFFQKVDPLRLNILLKNGLNLVEIGLYTQCISQAIQSGNRIIIFGVILFGHFSKMIDKSLLFPFLKRASKLLLVLHELWPKFILLFDVEGRPFFGDTLYLIQHCRRIGLFLLVFFLPSLPDFFNNIKFLRLLPINLRNLTPFSRKISVSRYPGIDMCHVDNWLHLSLWAVVFGWSPYLMKVQYVFHWFDFAATFPVGFTDVSVLGVFQHSFQFTCHLLL